MNETSHLAIGLPYGTEQGGNRMRKHGVNGNFSGELLLRRLQKLTSLNAASTELIMSLQKSRSHGPGSQITPDSDGNGYPRIIAVGWACRPRILSDGRCQMLSILLPGDILGDSGSHRPLEIAPVMALTSVRTISARPIYDAITRDPVAFQELAKAFAQIAHIEDDQMLEHIVSLGRRTALQRVAHCLLEFYHRALSIGFVQGGCFPMPVTQEILGDLLGLSLVHVNRVLSQLKRDGMIEMRTGVVCVPNVEKLAFLADYALPHQEAPGNAFQMPSSCMM